MPMPKQTTHTKQRENAQKAKHIHTSIQSKRTKSERERERERERQTNSDNKRTKSNISDVRTMNATIMLQTTIHNSIKHTNTIARKRASETKRAR